MHIGFEAKRAFFNTSGLGNYSRNTINGLSEFYPDIKLSLFTPGLNTDVYNPAKNIQVIKPSGFWKKFKAIWRRSGMTRQIKTLSPDIFHGLSHELPAGIENTNVKTVVTMHDLIFMRYPEFYKAVDIKIYKRKFKQACDVADKVIAISEQTKSDLIEFFGTRPEKIKVIYQGCNPAYFQHVSDVKKSRTLDKYNLPDNFMLSVGTIEERKNLMGILEAMSLSQTTLALVVVGRPTEYIEKCKAFITANGLGNKVHFFHNIDFNDLPAFYQLAKFMIYPSFFEGFGLPVLEAQASGCPVITSNISSMPEAGGDAAKYVDPRKPNEIAEAMQELNESDALREQMITDGIKHASNFRERNVIDNLMKVYQELV